MKITNEQAEYLLTLPKKVVENNTLLDELTIEQQYPFHDRFELVSERDDDFSFLWEIKQSKKNSIRISLHCQEDDSKIGLLRVDYNGGHTNPMEVTEFVPEKFRPYAGKSFSVNEHHIHYHVEGYSSLAWAIPLSVDEFAIKEIKQGPDFNHTFAETIKLFAKTIHIETAIAVNILLL
jgi:hypothetical protein